MRKYVLFVAEGLQIEKAKSVTSVGRYLKISLN